jgi:thiol-disulfide isomerase/thioredoxin
MAIPAAALALVAIVAIGLSQAGGGTGEGKSAGGACGSVPAELAGAPKPLAALHGQACDLLDGGPRAFKARLAELRGHPVVVNQWASWCGPCRAEFPLFQRLSRSLGKRVAFVGVDSMDNEGDAKGFLKLYPVSYPSYKDGDGTVAQVFNGVGPLPKTVFYDASGKLKFVHVGQYATEAALRRDISRYAGA